MGDHSRSMSPKGSSQCQALQILPVIGLREQAWLQGRGGHPSQLCSGGMKALPPCSPSKGKTRDSLGLQKEPEALWTWVLDIWRKSRLTPGKMDGTILHRATDFVRERNRQKEKKKKTKTKNKPIHHLLLHLAGERKQRTELGSGEGRGDAFSKASMEDSSTGPLASFPMVTHQGTQETLICKDC